ncbi:MAG: hypothetical protein HYY26_02205 [Acidobacteria bacterium]|nr:hypothetical protein [Acidobacteriota bacterium]
MKTVLVVGRDWQFRSLLRAQLREEGYAALGLETLTDAEEEIRRPDEVAAVVFDTTGAAAEELQTALPRLAARLPVVVVAGAQEEVPAAARVLRRPVAIGEVAAALRDLLAPRA